MSNHTVGCAQVVEPPAAPPAVGWVRASAPALFVWGVWGLLFASVLAFVLAYGRNVPHWDDWDMVPVVTGRQPLTLSWLCTPHNEHRIPLPKLLYLVLVRSCGYDLRAGMVFNVCCLASLAAGLILAARRQRGRTSAADAFFPLALLHLGQQQNLLWGFQVGFVLGTLLVGAILLFLTMGGESARSPGPMGIAGCLFLLPLCGANTLAFVPGIGLWLGYLGVSRWQGTATRKQGLALLICAAAAAGMVGLSFVGIRPVTPIEEAGTLARLRTAAQFLSTAPGPAFQEVWLSEEVWLSAAMGVVALSVVTGLLLLRFWRQRPTERPGALGLALFLAGFAVLALGVGWGRAALGERAGLANRYVTLAAPLLCGLYLAWGQCLPAYLGRVGQVILCVVMGLLLVPNTLHGLKRGHALHQQLLAVENDARRGMKPAEMALKYTTPTGDRPPILWAEWKRQQLEECLEILRQDRLGPFRGVDHGD